MLLKKHCAKKRAFNAQNSRRLFGFTIAELLVILLVSSIVMVILAPIVRKKDAGASGSNISTKIGSVLYDFTTSSSECTDSTADNTKVCNFKVPKNVRFITAFMVSGGGGGAGATNPDIVTGAKVTHASASQKTVKITADMRDVKVTYLTGGGGGAGGGTWTVKKPNIIPTSQSDCNSYYAKYLTASQNGGKPTCVIKYNLGDIPGLTNGGIHQSVTRTWGGASCTYNSCCWQGVDWRPRGCNSLNTTYSGCNRTTCTWQAGYDSCKALAFNGSIAGDWRMPVENEIKSWIINKNAIILNQGDNGLRLCDHYHEGGSVAYCPDYLGPCQGAYDNFCYPYIHWMNDTQWFNLERLNMTYGHRYNDQILYITNLAFSVRCTLKTEDEYTSLPGGGGAGAPYFKGYTIPQNIIDANVGGKIVMYAGTGGTGKASASSEGSSATAGTSGSESYIYVYDSSNVLKWGLKTPGGNGGGAATSTAAGTGGAQKASNSCQIYNGTSWASTACTGSGSTGSKGTIKKDMITSGAGTGGAGGGSMYNTTTLSGGGSGGSTSPNGSIGSLYGAGGGGGTISVQISGTTATIQKGTGGNGASGVAEIQYSVAYAAAAGGGGAGGSYALIENIPVKPETTYTVKVGGGGSGGAVNLDGTDGGATSISYNGGTFTLGGGKAGKKGTTETSTADAVQGLGGAVGSTNIPSKLVKLGAAGKQGTFANNISSGGNGGKSGLSTSIYGCGGFSTQDSCVNAASQGKNENYTKPSQLHSASKQYGSAGAGGGGGGWKMLTSSDSGPGGGASGQSGYVYIYWIEQE